MTRGPCAKRRVVCVITAADGTQFRGENDCERPQARCPRVDGKGYEKCAVICGQTGHAEIGALRAAGERAQASRADLWGHYWICEPCGRAMRAAGVATVTIHADEPAPLFAEGVVA